MNHILLMLFLGFTVSAGSLSAQQVTPAANLSGVYIDSQGILRWKNNRQEAAFFGVNYTVPFAYGYRSHRKLHLDPEKAIDRDVYHLARLGINAFRVHVWDTEISDSLGNLKNNEHLRLFDYLLAKLEERGIYTLITPIAFWGNGYPGADEKTGSFSELYGKDRALREERAFVAQEQYLRQFFNHVNPYTKKKYGEDPWIIAMEINNEPHHSGPKALTTAYINRMLGAVKNTGWLKPVFYNISESPAYADAVAASDVDGFSFQWYPAGLVSGHERKGNFLPNVDRYAIPFDTIPAFKGKPRMVYEFDAADVLQPLMYPAMARSFRTAGFQWATQFAYDPLATAYANTEYQTHYLNLAYTPEKAISLLIAAKAFRQLPLFRSYGTYPADTVFGPFRLSYAAQLSEMNSAEEYYYSNTTANPPLRPVSLKHIAGAGSSPAVNYSGSGAYFMDKLAGGAWRLEVMPDVVKLKDPFEKASPDREARRIVWRERAFHILLPDLGKEFTVKALNTGNSFTATATGGTFNVLPGVYLLERKGRKPWPVSPNTRIGYIKLTEFVAPGSGQAADDDPALTMPIAAENESAGNSILFAPGRDQSVSVVYAGLWGKNKYEYLKGSGGQARLRLDHQQQDEAGFAAVDVYIKGRIHELLSADTLVISAAATSVTPFKIVFADADGAAFSVSMELNTDSSSIRIPLSAFRPDSLLLMPRPYPGFQPTYFTSGKKGGPDLKRIEKLQLIYPVKADSAFSVTFDSVCLKQSDH